MKQKKQRKEVQPFDHSKQIFDYMDSVCIGTIEEQISATQENLRTLEEQIAFWEEIIEDDKEAGDEMLLSLDRKSLQEAKLEKVRLKNEIKMMNREKARELICA